MSPSPRLPVVLASALLVAGLTGCGSDEADDAPATEPTTAADTKEAKAAAQHLLDVVHDRDRAGALELASKATVEDLFLSLGPGASLRVTDCFASTDADYVQYLAGAPQGCKIYAGDGGEANIDMLPLELTADGTWRGLDLVPITST